MANFKNSPDPVRYQQNFFRHIIAACGDRKAVPLLGELLHLNKSAVYKRISGEKILGLDEFLVLTHAFQLSPEHLALSPDGRSSFQFDQLGRRVGNCAEYLELVAQNFQKFGKIPDLKIWFATNDLPLFYHGLFRELALFKLFAYARLNWQIPYTLSLDFHPDSFPEKAVYEQWMQPVWEAFASIPTIEIWTDKLFNNTARQIRHFAEKGQISDPSVVALLFEQLEALADLQEQMAEQGRKFRSAKGSLESRLAAEQSLYYSEVSANNMTMLMGKSPHFQNVYVVFDDPNFMVISDDRFCTYAHNWLTELRQKSIRISEDGAFVRHKFFQEIKAEVQRQKVRIS
jgi:hypothetical protein